MLKARKEKARKRAVIDRPVWFFLIEVLVIGNSKQPWIAGSKASVHVFVPGTKLEDALELLDHFLASEELERIDTQRARRYEPNQEEELEIEENYFREPLEQASSTNECAFGVFVVSTESATTHEDLPQ